MKYSEVNLHRKVFRYFCATLSTAIIISAFQFSYYQIQRANGNIDHSRNYLYMQGFEDHLGLMISMMMPIVLLFALLKLFILKKNDNYILNVLLFVLIGFAFFSLLASLTWGFNSGSFDLLNFLAVISPAFLFIFFLKLFKRWIKPVPESIINN